MKEHIGRYDYISIRLGEHPYYSAVFFHSKLSISVHFSFAEFKRQWEHSLSQSCGQNTREYYSQSGCLPWDSMQVDVWNEEAKIYKVGFIYCITIDLFSDYKFFRIGFRLFRIGQGGEIIQRAKWKFQATNDYYCIYIHRSYCSRCRCGPYYCIHRWML